MDGDFFNWPQVWSWIQTRPMYTLNIKPCGGCSVFRPCSPGELSSPVGMEGSKTRQKVTQQKTCSVICLSQLSCLSKMPYARRLQPQMFLSHSSGGWESEIRVQRGRALVRVLSLACWRPPSRHVLTWPFLRPCMHTGREMPSGLWGLFLQGH